MLEETMRDVTRPGAAMRLLQEIRFGTGGDDAPHLGSGWAGAEPDHRWSVGDASELWLANPGEGDLLLDIDAAAFVSPPELPHQRLEIRATTGGAASVLVGSVVLKQGVRRLGWRVPAGRLHGRQPLLLTFLHPDAARPIDYGHPDRRRLACMFSRVSLFGLDRAAPARRSGEAGLALARVAARTGLQPADLVGRFESLGDNCEFGLVQRLAGAEPLGLLRFANIELPNLLRGVDSGFEGLGVPEMLELRMGPGERNREYGMRDRAYGLSYHTHQYEADGDDAKVARTLLTQQVARLGFLRRKLREDMEAGEKILVIRRLPPLTEAEVLPLCASLGRHSPCTILWVTLADARNPPGTVERIMPRLLRAYLPRLAPYDDAHDLPFEAWLEVCANAVAIMT